MSNLLISLFLCRAAVRARARSRSLSAARNLLLLLAEVWICVVAWKIGLFAIANCVYEAEWRLFSAVVDVFSHARRTHAADTGAERAQATELSMSR